jgi:pyridinium-3,5-biscarboxylic acid mononucleotide sulfurtransferase
MLDEKLQKLKMILQQTHGCAIAFSGGVDSSLLVAVAHEVLGGCCLAVIATSSTYPKHEYKAAIRFARERGIPLVSIASEELDILGFRENPKDRCYYCKKELFEKIKAVADKRGLKFMADGNNSDDVNDYRPGLRAASELGVLSPLKEAGLRKEEIRQLAKSYDLPMADKPAMACLASRFPYGSSITGGKLEQVERVENFLREKGFRIFRARHHGDILRLELDPDEIETFVRPEFRTEFVLFVKAEGFAYVTLDMEGYRSGSMNEVLKTTK